MTGWRTAAERAKKRARKIGKQGAECSQGAQLDTARAAAEQQGARSTSIRWGWAEQPAPLNAKENTFQAARGRAGNMEIKALEKTLQGGTPARPLGPEEPEPGFPTSSCNACHSQPRGELQRGAGLCWEHARASFSGVPCTPANPEQGTASDNPSSWPRTAAPVGC